MLKCPSFPADSCVHHERGGVALLLPSRAVLESSSPLSVSSSPPSLSLPKETMLRSSTKQRMCMMLMDLQQQNKSRRPPTLCCVSHATSLESKHTHNKNYVSFCRFGLERLAWECLFLVCAGGCGHRRCGSHVWQLYVMMTFVILMMKPLDMCL